jgi:hypothetical protein
MHDHHAEGGCKGRNMSRAPHCTTSIGYQTRSSLCLDKGKNCRGDTLYSNVSQQLNAFVAIILQQGVYPNALWDNMQRFQVQETSHVGVLEGIEACLSQEYMST